ncbi:hypothetical protein FGG08_005318 [Glutinoglossum americanum]|uniref:Uncharacterized protein n=1 Tax=Glutinoglossum americanum TaxID=1670608 RepID=A0A9P8HYF1_9PEZI|nr:hypothetical protein FGG08_005318 [Glutinoglossum americanum]
MWLDRFSAQSTPSGSPPPPQNRSYSPAPRRPSHLAPLALPARPGFSPRSSSLSLASNVSTSSLPGTSRPPNGSTLRQSVTTNVHNVTDPLEVLQRIIGAPLKSREVESPGNLSGSLDQSQIAGDIDFGGLSLQEFVQLHNEPPATKSIIHTYSTLSVEEYEKEKDKFEDLHRSILACDEVLKSVETYLTSFQTDLGAVSSEIETLQSRSVALNTKLENRKNVEKLLGPAVEDISISPAIVRNISEGPIDEAWIKALEDVGNRYKAVEMKLKDQRKMKALDDMKPLLENLTKKACSRAPLSRRPLISDDDIQAVERARDYLVAQIKSLRSPNINAQIIQQQSFLKYKVLYVFLTQHHPKLAEDIGQAYINTMRWYYLNHFTRYCKALEKMKLYAMDKYDVLGQDEPPRRSNLLQGTKATGTPHDPYNLGRRIETLKTANPTALPAYLAEEDKSIHYLESPFRSFNLALVDNASAEYSFLTEFFSPNSYHQVSRKFNEIFEPTFALGQSLTKTLTESTVDCLGVLLCVRLNQHFAFELQRRKVPAVDSYINGTNMLLWPRFQIVMDMHCESLRRVSAASSSRGAASSLLLSASNGAKQSAAPHFLTQRFGQFLQGILALSSEAGDNEPVSSSLGRLRNDFEAFLTKLSKSIGEPRKRERFLFNNYSLVLTIIGDTDGKLAEEQKEHFEHLKQAFSDER